MCIPRFFVLYDNFSPSEQVFRASGSGRGKRNSAQGSRQTGSRDPQIDSGRDLGGPQIGRTIGQKETAAGESIENFGIAAIGHVRRQQQHGHHLRLGGFDFGHFSARINNINIIEQQPRQTG